MAPDPPYQSVWIDPKFYDEWLEFGMNELDAYLSKWAAFTRWLENHDRQEES